LLVEPQRTNLLWYSEQFDNLSYWTTYNASITANTTISPSGIQNADTITPSAPTGGDVYRLITLNGTYTATAYFKSGTATTARIGYSNGDLAIYNLTNQTIVTTGSVTATIEDAGNGWYRCSLTTTITAGAFVAYSSNGTTGQTIHLWGAQLELASYATSYIPTTSASVTRNADVVSKTGISSLIGQTEGTVFFDGIADITNPNGAILIYLGSSDGSGAFDYSTYLKFSGNNLNLTVYSGGVNYVNSTSTQTYTNKQNIKVAFSYKNNDFVCYANGVQLFTDTTGVVSTNLSSIALGFYPPNIPFNQYNGNINASALWKTRLTNTQLSQLTTI
jgi:hypothetical protein